MKKILFVLFIAIIFLMPARAQEAVNQLNDARTAYTAGNLKESRFALQQALHEIDMAIGAEILKVLPQNIGKLKIVNNDDKVTTAGFAGLFVSRSFRGDGIEDYSSIEIITDSPMITGINAILALPMFTSDANQKRIRIGNNRALLTRSQSKGGTSWDVQVPLGNTLLVFRYNGNADEKGVTDMANTLPVDAIVRLTR
jgi:hypothetical protein